MNILILGMPGSGKGTQAQKIVEKHKLQHISTGEVLKQSLQQDNERSKQIKQMMNDGLLIPDAIMNELVTEQLHQAQHTKVILDGYPRTVAQAQFLQEHLQKNNAALHTVLFLDLSDEEAVNRMKKRNVTEQRTDCSTDEKIQQRLQEYKDKTQPLLNFYEEQGLLKRIDSEPSIEEVFLAIAQHLEA